MLAAVALGAVIHVYTMFTPSFFRIGDFIINIIAGLVVFFLHKVGDDLLQMESRLIFNVCERVSFLYHRLAAEPQI